MNTIRLNSIGIDATPAAGGGGNGGGGNTPKWTGHADAEGLKAIGWTDEDIAYYQQNGVNWNAENDEYHKVSDDNKALYGLLNEGNIDSYRGRIVYLPKIDFARPLMLKDFNALVAIPQLNLSSCTSLNNFFENCHSLVCVPPMDTSHVTNMTYMFSACHALEHVGQLDTSKVTSINSCFSNCYSLKTVGELDLQSADSATYLFRSCSSLVSVSLLNTDKLSKVNWMFANCYSMCDTGLIDAKNITDFFNIFGNCTSLHTLYIKNINVALDFSDSALLSKESLLYLINNEAATSAITITLHYYAYTRLANDADIVAALAAHPNISLAK